MNSSPLTHDSRQDAGRQFLENFEAGVRGTICNIFLEPARADITSPDALLAAVRRDFERRVNNARRWRDLEREERYRLGLDLLREVPGEAIALARWAIWWEGLTKTERERIKASRGDLHRYATMAMQPPTDWQLAYLRALGYAREVASKAEATRLIDELKRGGAA